MVVGRHRKGASMSVFDGITDDLTGQDGSLERPPATNRGVTDYFLADFLCVGLDFLVYSGLPLEPSLVFPRGSKDDIIPGFSALDTLAFRSVVPHHPDLFLVGAGKFKGAGYDTSLAMSAGTLRYHSRRLDEQKINVTFSGQDLAYLRSIGISSQDLLQHVAGLPGSSVTRMDPAIDIFKRCDPFDLRWAYQRGEVQCKARGAPRFYLQDDIQDDGDFIPRGTVRFGSDSADRGLRVYDKAWEQQLPGRDWTRIEQVLRGVRADMLAERLAGADDFPQVIQASIRDYCDAPTVPWYCEALSGPAVDLPKVPRKDSDSLKYALGLVPFMEKLMGDCALLGDWRLYDGLQKACDNVLRLGKE